MDEIPEVLDLQGEFSSSQQFNIAGNLVALPFERRCITCNSRERYLIETGYLRGWARRTVIKTMVPESSIMWWPWPNDGGRRADKKLTEVRVSRRIASHIDNGHSPIDAALRQSVLERHAKEAGLDLDEVEGTIVTKGALLDLIKTRGYQLLAEDELEIKASDLLSAIKLEQTLDEAVGGVDADVDALHLAIRAFFQLLGEVMTDDQQRKFYWLLESRPEIMRVLMPQPLSLASGS